MKYTERVIPVANMEDKTQDTLVKERVYIVKWMKGIIAGKASISEQKAFMSKSNSICIYHNITLEELILQDS